MRFRGWVAMALLGMAASTCGGVVTQAPQKALSNTVTPCMQEVANAQTAMDTYRNNPPPQGDGTNNGPGPLPTLAQLGIVPKACKSLYIDAAYLDGTVRGVEPNGVTVP